MIHRARRPRRRLGLLALGAIALVGACRRDTPARDAAVPAVLLRGTVIARDSATLVFVACGASREQPLLERRFADVRRALTAVRGAVKDSAFMELDADTVGGRVDVRETRYATAAAEGSPCDRPHGTWDYEAIGNEPFWRVTVEDSAIVLERPEPPLETYFTLDSAAVSGGMRVLHATRDIPPMPKRYIGPPPVKSMVLSLLRAECRDGMSDSWYPYRAELRFGTLAWHGCARR